MDRGLHFAPLRLIIVRGIVLEATQARLSVWMTDWGEARVRVTSFGVGTLQEVQVLVLSTLGLLSEIVLHVMVHPLLLHPIGGGSLSLLREFRGLQVPQLRGLVHHGLLRLSLWGLVCVFLGWHLPLSDGVMPHHTQAAMIVLGVVDVERAGFDLPVSRLSLRSIRYLSDLQGVACGGEICGSCNHCQRLLGLLSFA
jgi:hypothetical protein